jgi:hypothetical protein
MVMENPLQVDPAMVTKTKKTAGNEILTDTFS